MICDVQRPHESHIVLFMVPYFIQFLLIVLLMGGELMLPYFINLVCWQELQEWKVLMNAIILALYKSSTIEASLSFTIQNIYIYDEIPNFLKLEVFSFFLDKKLCCSIHRNFSNKINGFEHVFLFMFFLIYMRNFCFSINHIKLILFTKKSKLRIWCEGTLLFVVISTFPLALS